MVWRVTWLTTRPSHGPDVRSAEMAAHELDMSSSVMGVKPSNDGSARSGGPGREAEPVGFGVPHTHGPRRVISLWMQESTWLPVSTACVNQRLNVSAVRRFRQLSLVLGDDWEEEDAGSSTESSW